MNNISTRTLLPLLALLPDEALPIEQVGVNLLHCLLKVSRQLHLQIKSWMVYGWYDVVNKPSPRVLREMQLSQLSSCRGSTPPPPPSPWHTGSLPGDRLTWSSYKVRSIFSRPCSTCCRDQSGCTRFCRTSDSWSETCIGRKSCWWSTKWHRHAASCSEISELILHGVEVEEVNRTEAVFLQIIQGVYLASQRDSL